MPIIKAISTSQSNFFEFFGIIILSPTISTSQGDCVNLENPILYATILSNIQGNGITVDKFNSWVSKNNYSDKKVLGIKPFRALMKLNNTPHTEQVKKTDQVKRIYLPSLDSVWPAGEDSTPADAVQLRSAISQPQDDDLYILRKLIRNILTGWEYEEEMPEESTEMAEEEVIEEESTEMAEEEAVEEESTEMVEAEDEETFEEEAQEEESTSEATTTSTVQAKKLAKQKKIQQKKAIVKNLDRIMDKVDKDIKDIAKNLAIKNIIKMQAMTSEQASLNA